MAIKYIGQEPQNDMESLFRRERVRASSFDQLRGKRILDVGCGSGDVYKSYHRDLAHLDAVEPEPALRSLASQTGIYHNVYSDIKEVAPEDYDYVTIFGVYEHIDNRPKFLKDFRDAPAIFITVPNGSSFHRMLGAHLGLISDCTELTKNDRLIGHQIVFTPTTLRDEIQDFCDQFGFYISRFGSMGFKITSNHEMEMFKDRFQAISEVAEDCGIIGENSFFGAELYIEIIKKGETL